MVVAQEPAGQRQRQHGVCGRPEEEAGRGASLEVGLVPEERGGDRVEEVGVEGVDEECGAVEISDYSRLWERGRGDG